MVYSIEETYAGDSILNVRSPLEGIEIKPLLSDSSKRSIFNVVNKPFEYAGTIVKDGSSFLNDTISNNVIANNVMSNNIMSKTFEQKDVETATNLREALPQDVKIEKKIETCYQGQTYQVTHPEQLRKMDSELECIYSLGIAPIRPPMGVYFGGVLSVFRSKIFNPAFESLWAGKIGVRTQCKKSDSKFSMVFNIASNDFAFPAYLYVGTLEDKMKGYERDDGRRSLFIDYTIDLEQTCPSRQQDLFKLNMGVSNPMFPMNQLIDMARVVGRSNDGGYIVLGKCITRNVLEFPHEGDQTIAWWYAVNYDEFAFPFIPAEIGPLEKGFQYENVHLSSLFDITKSIQPSLVKDPIAVGNILMDYIFRKPLGIPAVSKQAMDSDKYAPTAGTVESGIILNSYQKPLNYQKPMGDYDFSGRKDLAHRVIRRVD